jgi:hypothetical protein
MTDYWRAILQHRPAHPTHGPCRAVDLVNQVERHPVMCHLRSLIWLVFPLASVAGETAPRAPLVKGGVAGSAALD